MHDEGGGDETPNKRTATHSSQYTEIQQYIKDHVRDFARHDYGWHLEMALSVLSTRGLARDELEIVYDLVHEEAKRNGLFPYTLAQGDEEL